MAYRPQPVYRIVFAYPELTLNVINFLGESVDKNSATRYSQFA